MIQSSSCLKSSESAAHQHDVSLKLCKTPFLAASLVLWMHLPSANNTCERSAAPLCDVIMADTPNLRHSVTASSQTLGKLHCKHGKRRTETVMLCIKMRNLNHVLTDTPLERFIGDVVMTSKKLLRRWTMWQMCQSCSDISTLDFSQNLSSPDVYVVVVVGCLCLNRILCRSETSLPTRAGLDGPEGSRIKVSDCEAPLVMFSHSKSNAQFGSSSPGGSY